jgi:hypothetical protein
MIETKNRKQPDQPIAHTDQIGQPLLPGQPVAFCYSGAPGICLGTVVKLTKQRVRVAYKHKWMDRDNNIRINEWNYLAHPDRTLVLSESLPQELTMLKLKGLLP